MRLIAILFVLMTSISSPAQDSEPALFAESLRLIQQGQLELAATALKKLVIRSPKNNLYWFNLATVEALLGHHDYAIRVFGRVILMKSPLAPAAQFYTAKSLRALGRDSEARAILQELSKLELPVALRQQISQDLNDLNAPDREDEALQAYRKGDLQRVESLLLQSPIESLSSDAALLLAIVSLKAGQFERASESLTAVVQHPSTTAERKSLALDLLKRSQQREARRYWVMLDASAGYNSNAFSDGQSVATTPSFQHRTSVAAGYHFQKGQPLSVKATSVLSYEEPVSVRELRTLTQTFQLPVILEKTNRSLSMIPLLQWQNWAGVSVSEKTGLALKGSVTQEQFDFGGDAEFSTLRSTNNSYSYLQGNSSVLKPYLGFFGQNLYAQVAYQWGRDGTQDIRYSDGSILPLEHTYQGPSLKLIWRPTDMTAAFLNLSSLQKNFSAISLPSLKNRSDRELLLSFKYSYWVNPRLSVYGLGEYTANSSTLGSGDVRDKNYEIFTWMAGFAWDVF